ncbi:hypothetical protein H1O16_gp437 [Burkholderia phage BcepSaruman]|uniref:NADAR domain-containing protein n=1 Tax=Burkholderia phage BcepSaruman TaxID=2530032 RepID=A0A4D5ZDR0_9CAUD|nr:hypothetical protein H1O16_gp437 [Burkholderia phage BcepSaruman]QBX06850.1 hypothetical protein BcepSaruman_437 [Burkholderia phage BcepSaruman]
MKIKGYSGVARGIDVTTPLPYSYDPDFPPVHGFYDEYEFLSNFYDGVPVSLFGMLLPSSEHWYMWHKDSRPTYKKKIKEARTPGNAKRVGYTARLPADWNEKRRYQVMYTVLCAKFVDPRLAQRLVDTWPAHLEETNRHGDEHWGRCGGVGANHLGRLLMVVRHRLMIGTLRPRDKSAIILDHLPGIGYWLPKLKEAA